MITRTQLLVTINSWNYSILNRTLLKQYITEVKVQITHHQLQTAIGQLILYRYTYDENAELQIALPKETDMTKLSNDLSLHLETKENFHFLFVP